MNNSTPGRKEIRSELTEQLGVHLANMYTLMLRLQNFHWHVKGKHFYSSHQMFEKHYQGIWKEVDEVAERIRIMGEKAPATFNEFVRLSLLIDRPEPTDSDGMFDEMITCCVIVREFCGECLKTAGLIVDEVTADMLIRQMTQLEKMIWFYRSSLSTEDFRQPKSNAAFAMEPADNTILELYNKHNVNGRSQDEAHVL